VVADALQREADAKLAASESAKAGGARLAGQLAEMEAGRASLAGLSGAGLAGAAEAMLGEGSGVSEPLIALARTAGAAAGGADAGPLRTQLASLLTEQSSTASTEAAELLKRSESFGRKAAEALRRGEPTAETRRIQSETALLAALRRQADADVLAATLANVPTARLEDLLGTATILVDRPLTPIARLAGAETEADRLAAARAVNAAEQAAAQALIADQAARRARLEAALGSLRTAQPDNADAISEQAMASARSRLARLERELAVYAAGGETLAVLAGEGTVAPAPAGTPDAQRAPDAAPPAQAATPFDGPGPAPAPVDPAPGDTPPEPAATPAERLATETDAQIGLDFGGPLAVAFALGGLDAGAPNAEAHLRSLLAAQRDIDIADARKDISRLQRKEESEASEAAALGARIGNPSIVVELDPLLPSVLVEIGGGVVKAERIGPDGIEGRALVSLTATGPAAAGAWTIRTLHTAEADRLVSDRQAAWANDLKASGHIIREANLDLLTRADSTYPELAGLAAALAGSFWIILVTLVLSLPIGVMAAIYLQEFAPKNRITDLIEVNINNLAAVPSIVFGLLGAAVFINFFGFPRSAPVVGGMVLSLITLPTIIIATRAAIGAVPPSIRDGALAVGASLPQAVFHHILPLAAPGIMTGAIIGLARALGETAPLLLIGMVAFVAEPPDSMFDSATALPVLVYKWASAAERAWQPMTSAAILVLLAFMFTMNALAVYLRRRLERRW
jgi:phosphate ABC transporter permease subunit PstA